MRRSCRRSARYSRVRRWPARCAHPVARIRSPAAPVSMSQASSFLPAPKPVSPTGPERPTSCARAIAALPSSKRSRRAPLPSAPKRSGCAMNAERASRHSTSARAGRSPLPSSARQANRDRGPTLRSGHDALPAQSVVDEAACWSALFLSLRFIPKFLFRSIDFEARLAGAHPASRRAMRKFCVQGAS